jgi:hypothetical protein
MIYHTRGVTPVTPVSSTNKTDSHDITEILLKVALITITLTLTTLEHHTNHYTTDAVACVRVLVTNIVLFRIVMLTLDLIKNVEIYLITNMTMKRKLKQC